MTLSLGSDGSATLTQDWGKGAKTLFGSWADAGGQITLTFQGVPGQPAEPPMTFRQGHGGLVAATWNRAEWGKAVPPPMKKQNGNWHSGGDHHGFW